MTPLWWNLLNLFACVPLAMILINLLTWTRGRLGYKGTHRLSVLIPARNEAENIETCISAIAKSDVAVEEIIVYDDQSSDQTPEILSRLTRRHPALKVIRGTELPLGWIGKPHACHHLAKAARGDIFLFVDADTVLEPDGIRRLLSILSPTKGRNADLVTAVPRQLMESALERLLMPLLLLTYTSWFPLWLVANSRNHRFLAANGQLLMIRRSVYEKLGGFAQVANEIVDDMALCRMAKKRRARVAFMDGYKIARCRMYRSAEALWNGFTKNIYEGIGENPLALVVVIGLYTWAFLWPYASLVITWALGLFPLFFTALIGVTANLLSRLTLSRRYGHPMSGVLLHPVAIIVLLALSINSFWCNLRGTIQWRGRAYTARRRRSVP